MKQSQNAETPLVVLMPPKKLAANGIMVNFVITLLTFQVIETSDTSQTWLTWKGLDSSSDNGKIRSYKDLFKCSSKGKSSELLGDLPTVMEER